MRALNQLSPNNATEAMQKINITVYRSLFMVLFMTLAIGSIVIALWSIAAYGLQDSIVTILGSLFYIFGMFTLTGRGNVPLNESLRETSSSAPDIDAIWKNYSLKWNQLNMLRCLFGVLAGGCWFVSAHILGGMS